MTRRIGALTISQSPRRDLLAPLYAKFPNYEIIEAGALDMIDISNLPDGTQGYYPLTTTLNNGDIVTLDRNFLKPLLQDALEQLESYGVMYSILLCAGDFPDIYGEQPLIKPSAIAQHILATMGIQQIVVISPIDVQNKPIHDKWKHAGFEPMVWTMPTDTTSEQQAEWINYKLTDEPDADCIVLDYVGYPTESILRLHELVKKPIFDLGHLAISTLF